MLEVLSSYKKHGPNNGYQSLTPNQTTSLTKAIEKEFLALSIKTTREQKLNNFPLKMMQANKKLLGGIKKCDGKNKNFFLFGIRRKFRFFLFFSV